MIFIDKAEDIKTRYSEKVILQRYKQVNKESSFPVLQGESVFVFQFSFAVTKATKLRYVS